MGSLPQSPAVRASWTGSILKEPQRISRIGDGFCAGSNLAVSPAKVWPLRSDSPLSGPPSSRGHTATTITEDDLLSMGHGSTQHLGSTFGLRRPNLSSAPLSPQFSRKNNKSSTIGKVQKNLVAMEQDALGTQVSLEECNNGNDSMVRMEHIDRISETLQCSQKPLEITLSDEAKKEIGENEKFLVENGLIGKFNCLWPSLPDLHWWITESWQPILKENLEIYPCTGGFFVVVFDNIGDRNTILCSIWVWGQHLLMLKPWHLAFNPATESFTVMHIWVRLLNLPLHFWVDSCFESIGNTLGKFLATDNDSSDYIHTTFARILVDLDTSKDLSVEIIFKVHGRSWTQPLDYEGLPFQCRRCYKTGHMAANYPTVKVKSERLGAWWKDVAPQHYTVECTTNAQETSSEHS